MKILVSACLLGQNCKYNGKNNYNHTLIELLKGHEVFPVCPEVMGGLPTPRIPCERCQNRVIGKDGLDYTQAYREGAKKAIEVAKAHSVDCAIVKSRSPSCGKTLIYDGTFQSILIPGSGVFCESLNRLQIPVIEV